MWSKGSKSTRSTLAASQSTTSGLAPSRAGSWRSSSSFSVMPTSWSSRVRGGQRLVVAGCRPDLVVEGHGVGQAPVQLGGLLAHQRGGTAPHRAVVLRVVLAEQMAELVVDQHLPVGRQVARPLRRGVAPTLGVEHHEGPVLAAVLHVDVVG